MYGNLKPEHGYAKKSRIFNDLMKFMCKLDKKNSQRQNFTTGISSLTIGGLKSLSINLTIVKRAFAPKEIPDDVYFQILITFNNFKLF